MEKGDRIWFVQVSDLHFGDDPTTPRRYGGVRRGYDPHDHQLASALRSGIETALADAGVPDDDPVPLIVSGDLTVAGTARQFDLADSFLRGAKAGQLLPAWGLAWNEPVFEIPGNHDHWDGTMPFATSFLRRQRGYNPRIFRPPVGAGRHFELHPWRREVSTDALRIEFYGIDSQSGLKGKRTNLRARGAISDDQLDRLRDLLAEADVSPQDHAVVRVAVVHHPLEAAPGVTHLLESESLRRLEWILAAHHFDVALVGHAHTFRVRRLGIQAVVPTQPTHWLLELRAPSALQGSPEDGVHGFLVHEVGFDPSRGSARWTWRLWVWNSAGRFEKSPAEEHSIEL